MLRRTQLWSNKLLSFGGRAQLISSVLFSIQVYWSSIFILPQQIIEDIEGMLSAFLWKGLEIEILWCQGGLSFKRMKEWNRASMLGHLCAVCKKEDILWVKWIHSNVIKNHCIWTIKLPADSSWTLRKIFGLRREGQKFILSRIGNGSNTYLWLDKWHTLGPLFQKIWESSGF